MTPHATDADGLEARGQGEGGFALIEILVSVTILGIAFVAILGGMATATNTSELHRQQAQVDAVLVSAVERVKALDGGVPCALATDPTYLAAAREALPVSGDPADPDHWGDSTLEITEIKYWNGLEYIPDVVACEAVHAEPQPLLALQEITLQVTHPRGRESNSLTFVKDVGSGVLPEASP